MISLKTTLRLTPPQNKQRKTENRRGTHPIPGDIYIQDVSAFSDSGVDGVWGHDKYKELLEI